MNKIVLNAKTRIPKQEGDFKGFVKGVVYGPELEENKLVWVKAQEFGKAYEKAGKSTLVDLQIEGEKEPLSVLFHEMQYDGLTNDLMHIDFYKVKMGEKIDTEIELEFIGESPAVKEQGGILVKGHDSLEVRCFPRHLISHIDVDLSVLKDFDDAVRVEDIKVPAEIEILTSADSVVVSISRPRTEEEIEKLDEKVEMDVDKVEVEKGGAKEESEEGNEDKKDEKPAEDKKE